MTNERRTDEQGRRPTLVAHRGHAARCPENTLPALRSALEAGAAALECDVQLSADGVPVLCHDVDLRRTAGVDAEVTSLALAGLRNVDVGEATRLGETYRGTSIPTLAEVVDLLRRWPAVEVFVEIKPESLRRFGVDPVVAPVVEVLRPVASRAVVISFDVTALETARRLGANAVGWVLDAYDPRRLERAETLRPECLVANVDLLPPGVTPPWAGVWQWMIYEITDPDEAVALGERGVAYVETMQIARMLSDPRLAPARRPGVADES